jgi:hypothetical protein
MSATRQTLLEQLLALFAASKSGAAQFALLQAGAGLGKSHLLQTMAHRIPPHHGFVHGDNFIGALLQALQPMLGTERDPEFLEAARSFAPQGNWVVVAAMPIWNANKCGLPLPVPYNAWRCA